MVTQRRSTMIVTSLDEAAECCIEVVTIEIRRRCANGNAPGSPKYKIFGNPLDALSGVDAALELGRHFGRVCGDHDQFGPRPGFLDNPGRVPQGVGRLTNQGQAIPGHERHQPRGAVAFTDTQCDWEMRRTPRIGRILGQGRVPCASPVTGGKSEWGDRSWFGQPELNARGVDAHGREVGCRIIGPGDPEP